MVWRLILPFFKTADLSSDCSLFLQRHVWAWAIGGCFSFLAILISAFSIYRTWQLNPKPTLRKYVILILLMVPVYALAGWLGLYQKEYTRWWDLGRECYEAITIYAFYEFLAAFLGGEEHMESILSRKLQQKHLIPFCCLPSWRMGEPFYRWTRFGTLQYVFVKLGCALIAFICSFKGAYNDSELSDPANAYPYMLVSSFNSAGLLINFLQRARHELQPDLGDVLPRSFLFGISR